MTRELVGYGLITLLFLGAAAMVIVALRNRRKVPHRFLHIVKN
jgi:hypothetical protein